MMLHDNILIVNDMAGLVSRLRRRITGVPTVAFVTDRNVMSEALLVTGLIGKVAPSALLTVIEPGEGSKTLDVVAALGKDWLMGGIERKSLIVNIGGGVVSDLGGFSASVFKRGIRFINVPTSLLAMVDASVGGKTGVNLFGAKNQVGSFARAEEVIIWPGFLKWLPARELNSGFAECVKHGLIQGGDALKLIGRGLPVDQPAMTALIEASVQYKSSVVAADLRETGQRRVLNFGHTVGHAFESASHLKGHSGWLHGESVAAGMIVALRLSVCIAGLDQRVASEWEQFILQQIPIPAPDGISAEQVMDFLQFDKKSDGGVPKFVLLKAPGEPIIDVEVDRRLLLGEIETVLSLIA